MIIALEGLPAVGKTTAAGNVAARLGAIAVNETTGDHPFLAQVYDDANRDDLTVELAFLLVHANPYRRLDRSRLNICDYSPVKDLLFAEDMLRGAELEFFRQSYNFIYEGCRRPDLVVYMRADPAFALGRARERMGKDIRRRFEARMTQERLERMHRRYEAAFEDLADDCLILDVVAEFNEDHIAEAIVELLRPRIEALPSAD